MIFEMRVKFIQTKGEYSNMHRNLKTKVNIAWSGTSKNVGRTEQRMQWKERQSLCKTHWNYKKEPNRNSGVEKQNCSSENLWEGV